MNYNNYIIDLKLLLSKMSEEEKTEWIFNAGRRTPESNRMYFLEELNPESKLMPLSYDKESFEEWFKKIESGELYFETRIDEDDDFHGYYNYNDWDREDSFIKMDPFEIDARVGDAFSIARNFVIEKKYDLAFDLYKRLMGLRFFVLDKDSRDMSDFSLKRMCRDSFVSFNFISLALEYMYLIYQSYLGESRSSLLYEVVENYLDDDFKIVDLFVVGHEALKGIDLFMEEWISFLVKIESDRVSELIIEACMYLGGIDYLCEIARAHYLKHPLLFKSACEQLFEEDDYQTCENVGLEGIELITSEFVIRSKIADVVAKAAANLDHDGIVQKCRLEAFYSHSTLSNYFRLFGSYDFNKMSQLITDYAKQIPQKRKLEYYSRYEEGRLNSITEEDLNVIRFFNGEYDALFSEFRNDETILGWSLNFKGIMVPLFILMLNREKELSSVSRLLLSSVVSRFHRNSSEVFEIEKFFVKWKKNHCLREIQEEYYLVWVLSQIEKRTQAILDGKLRKSYHKVALLIVAMGETLESRGLKTGKEQFVDKYKKEYTRFRAFKDEIEEIIKIEKED